METASINVDRMRRRVSGGFVGLAVFFAFWAGAALAHPHQFVTIDARLLLDAKGRFWAIEARFAMDETESLYIASEFGLDPDGPLTAAQSAELFKLYAAGYAEFNWFTHVSQNGEALKLVLPKTGSVAMKDGVLSVDWTLPLERPASLEAAPILLQFYDPTYYAEAALNGAPALAAAEGTAPSGCAVVFQPHAPTEETKAKQRLLALLPPEVTPEDPTVGRLFADRVEARCDDGAGQS